MFHLLRYSVLTAILAVIALSQAPAADGQPVQVKVYKAPG